LESNILDTSKHSKTKTENPSTQHMLKKPKPKPNQNKNSNPPVTLRRNPQKQERRVSKRRPNNQGRQHASQRKRHQQGWCVTHAVILSAIHHFMVGLFRSYIFTL